MEGEAKVEKSIKPIETKYNGFRFRSRLEARWAVFFDMIGLKYEYEVEGFDMNGIRYLPDFYIPSLDRWFEIKGKREIEVYGSKNEQRDPQLSGVHVYGTEPAPVYFLPACHRCGGRDLFWLGKVCGTGNDRVAVHLRGCPFRSLWFFPVPWHECGAVCLGVYQV